MKKLLSKITYFFILFCSLSLMVGGNSTHLSENDRVVSWSTYQIARNNDGDILRSEIMDMDEPELWLNGERLTYDDAIQFDPTINDSGDIAYAQLKNSNSYSKIILNDRVVSDDKTLKTNPTLSDAALYYLKIRGYDHQYSLYRYDLKNSELRKRILKNMIPEGLYVYDGKPIVSGFDPTNGVYRFILFDRKLGQILLDKSSFDPFIIHQSGTNLSIIQVNGSAELKKAFFAYHYFYGKQYGEPFSFGNDYLGRLSWNQSYRLRALNELYTKTKDPNIPPFIRGAVDNILNNAGDSGLFSSKKYSLDKTSPIELPVNNSLIYYSILKNIDHLTIENRVRAISFAEDVFDYYENDWIGYYRFRPCIKFSTDGVVMPYNQQNAVGLMTMELYKVTNNAKYLNRVEDLYENFLNDLTIIDGVSYWHYWPSTFYSGWEYGEIDSCNFPSKTPSTDYLFEDYSHAQINIEFVELASQVLGRDSPIDIDALAEVVVIDDYEFSRFISGDTDYTEPSYLYLPSWMRSEQIKSYYQNLMIKPDVDFDKQRLFLAYTKSLDGIIEDNEKLHLRKYIIRNQHVDVISEVTFTNVKDIGCIATYSDHKPKQVFINNCYYAISQILSERY